VGFEPLPGEPDYMYNAGAWEIPGKDTIVVGFTQEPASLYTLVEQAFVAVLANGLTSSYHYGVTWLNYDYNPNTLSELPILENNDVEVSAGEMVADATGTNVELAAGVVVKDATGAEANTQTAPLR
jgi:hypothetical protein